MGFLGDDLVDVGGEEGVGFADFGPDGALDGGFDFGLCAGGDAGWGKIIWLAGVCYGLVPLEGISWNLLFLEHVEVCWCRIGLVWRTTVDRVGGMPFGGGGRRARRLPLSSALFGCRPLSLEVFGSPSRPWTKSLDR